MNEIRKQGQKFAFTLRPEDSIKRSNRYGLFTFIVNVHPIPEKTWLRLLVTCTTSNNVQAFKQGKKYVLKVKPKTIIDII